MTGRACRNLGAMSTEPERGEGVVVAAVQFRATTEKETNLKLLGELVAVAGGRGARLVVAPEFSMYAALDDPAGAARAAEDLDGSFVRSLSLLAREAGVALVAGIVERAGDPVTAGGPERPFNTVVALAPDGSLIGRYRKLHLYDAFGFRESELFSSGAHGRPLVFDVGELTVGVMTCYDLRFPEMGRYLVDAGAQVLAVPAAWVAGPLKEDHWITLLRARAIENTCYVVGAGQTGPGCAAQSVVVDPMGVILAGAGEAPGAAVATASLERLASVRQALPSLLHRRLRVVAGD